MVASSLPPMGVGAGLIAGGTVGDGVITGVGVGDVQPATRIATRIEAAMRRITDFAPVIVSLTYR
jgi:hypothetical protein